MDDLLTLFNNKLKELPSISKNLSDLICRQGWSKEKTQHALIIVQQLSGNLLEVTNSPLYSSVHFKQLQISLSPSECGIDSAIFKSGTMMIQADKYISDLLDEINCISKNINFSFSGHNCCSGSLCIFKISLNIFK